MMGRHSAEHAKGNRPHGYSSGGDTEVAVEISNIQCRMARAAMCWSVLELSARAWVTSVALRRFELGGQDLGAATRVALRRVFETEGIRFGLDGAVYPPDGQV